MDSRIGQVLMLAGIVTPSKVEVALIDQQMQPDLRLGEILALRGWVEQDTVDYFAEMLPVMMKAESRLRLGEYFVCAGLLSEANVSELLAEQEQTGLPLGQLAVRKGYLKQETIDFFLQAFALGTQHNRATQAAAKQNSERQSRKPPLPHGAGYCLKVDSQLLREQARAKTQADNPELLDDSDFDDELDFEWLG